jgi:hypothetical protein
MTIGVRGSSGAARFTCGKPAPMWILLIGTPIGTPPGGTTAYPPLVDPKITLHHKALKKAKAVPSAIKTGFHMPRQDTTGNWEGHQPVTSARLLDVMTTATSGSAKVSRSEKALFTACEFWASARNHNLLGQLSDDAITQLRAAEASFTVIGLTQAASVLRRARLHLTETDPPPALSDVVENIEKCLGDSGEPVDQALAEFAGELARNRQT